MPSFFLLLLMSLTVASEQAKDKTRLAKGAAGKTSVIKARPGAISAEKKDDARAMGTDSDKIARPISLPETIPPPPAMAIIEAVAKPLSIMSEIDAPIIARFFPSDKLELTPAQIAVLIEQKPDEPIEVKSVAAFFKNSASVEDWMSDEEKEMARGFGKLIVTLEAQLENPQVYIFGERERSVVVIGKVKGGFGGVVTLIVET